MTTVIRIDVRKSLAEAEELAAVQAAKGLPSSIERSMLAVWNWSPTGLTADVVASDSDNEVYVVITRAP